MKSTTRLGPWPLGIDNVSGRTALRSADDGRAVALRDAVNVDVDRAGHVSRRRGAALRTAAAGLHSVWAGASGAYGVLGGVLYTLPDLTAVATLASDDPCSFAEVAGSLIVGNRTTLLRVAAGAGQDLAIPDASPPMLSAQGTGGLDAGRYVVAVCFLRDGVEGGLSPLRAVEVPANGGMHLTGLLAPPGADGVRVFRSVAGSETLLRVADLPLGVSDCVLGAGQLGREAQTQGLRAMVPGRFVAAWRGRLVTAAGRWLRVSAPMRYHLHDPITGFVQFASRVTMVAPVDGGIFVGTRTGVEFLRGTRPREWTREVTGARAPLEGQPAPILPGDVADGLELSAPGMLWLAPNGFVLGTPGGQVVQLQADRLQLTGQRAALCVLERRVTAAVG